MVSQPSQPSQPQPQAALEAFGRVEIGLAVLIVSACPVCGVEHVVTLGVSETRAGGVLHWRIVCTGPEGDAAPPHIYFARANASTIARAIERDTPRRVWAPYTTRDDRA